MIHRVKYNFAHVFLAMAFALASAVNGGAHKISEPIDDATRAYFLEMGGSLADLCGDLDLQSGLTSSCEVCNLVSAAVLPTCEDVSPKFTFAQVNLHATGPKPPSTAPNAYQNGIRAPPLV